MKSDACSKFQLVDKSAYAFELSFFYQHCTCEAVEGRFGRKAPALFFGLEVDELSHERQIVGLEVISAICSRASLSWGGMFPAWLS